jgi:hypothetical protein
MTLAQFNQTIPAGDCDANVWVSRDATNQNASPVPIAFDLHGSLTIVDRSSGNTIAAVDANTGTTMWGIPYFGWIVDREGGGYADASCGVNSSVDELAAKIGLSASDYTKWLSPADGGSLPSSSSEKMTTSRTFHIPNVVVCYWAGNVGGLGQSWVDWDDSVTYLKALGFDVAEYTHEQGSFDALQSILETSAEAKQLHGLYFWGHGDGMGLYAGDGAMSVTDQVLAYLDHWEDPNRFIKGIRLPYKMALGLVFSCHSNFGKHALVSCAPGCIWHGYTNVLVPLSDPDAFSADNYIHPGDQETK